AADGIRDFHVTGVQTCALPIFSTQMLMASGAALSFKLRKQDRVAVAVCGDGGSSKTDFYAAVNSAGAYTLPLVLCVVNNGWAIKIGRASCREGLQVWIEEVQST